MSNKIPEKFLHNTKEIIEKNPEVSKLIQVALGRSADKALLEKGYVKPNDSKRLKTEKDKSVQ